MNDFDDDGALHAQQELEHQEYLEMNDSVVSFYGDLVAAKQAFPAIRRNKTVKVRTKSGGEYTFAYAPLEEVMRVEPVLLKHGFVLTQAELVADGCTYVETTLAHKGGHAISGKTRVIVTEQGSQAHGSGLTYARRYGITLLLCLVTDEDDDGNAADGNEATKTNSFRDDSGKPPGWDKQDTKMVTTFYNRIMNAASKSDDRTMLEIWQEACEDHAFGTAVWVTLPKPIQHKIQDLKGAA